MNRKQIRSLGIPALILVVLFIAIACTAPALQDLATPGGEEAVTGATAPPAADEAVAVEGEEVAEAAEEEVDDAEPETAPTIYQDIPVGFTEEGHPYRGDPDAPITVYEFSDYECPFCQRHVIQTEPALKESFVSTGQARFVFRDMPLESLHPQAIPAAVAANCVAEQGIVPFWRMHDLLFRTQQEWAQASDPNAVFARLAEEAGADPEAFAACVADAEEIRAQIDASLADAQALGFTGTPSFNFVREETGESFQLVGAQPYEVFAQWFETLAQGGTPVDPAAAQREQEQDQAEIPFWATEEGLAPDPENEGLTVAGDYWRGDPDAPLVVVEFSDFQCPYCRQHVLQTQPVLDEQFIEVGDVMWVFKHFPVQSTHPQAFDAAIAAECAGQQGQFWEMHDLLFERTEEWDSAGTVESGLDALAEELGLDMGAFNACQAEEATLQAVDEDLQAGAPFIRGTPTFVVLFDEQGQLIPGALPADQFSAALEQMLAAATGDDAESE